jgi:ribosomal protein S20
LSLFDAKRVRNKGLKNAIKTQQKAFTPISAEKISTQKPSKNEADKISHFGVEKGIIITNQM